MPRLPEYTVNNFNKGLITRVESESLPKGAVKSSLNWMFLGDHIELRRGQELMGSEVSGTGGITGMKVGLKSDGTNIPFRSRDQKVEYYDADTEDWIESGSDVLGADADGEEVSFDQYQPISGDFMYLSSPNSSIYKIAIANPGDIKDQNSTSHRGYIKFKIGAMYLWNRKDANGGFDKTGLYRSWIDKDELSDFTETTSENVGTGDGSTVTFAGTLAAVTGVKTCMYVRITDGTETFIDDRNGVMVGNAGGTGTINYTTGSFSVTFNTAPTNSQAITADYYTEDATNEGVVDFSKSVPRSAGEGFRMPQDIGADLMNISTLKDTDYVFHKLNIWDLSISADDTDAIQDIYRSRLGIPNWRALQETGDGIYFMDATNQNDPYVRILEIGVNNSEVIPRPISQNINLSSYRFDKSVLFLWGNYIVLACRTEDSTINNRAFFYDRIWDTWQETDFRISCMDAYSGTLIAGDSGSKNVFKLFSGFSDEDSNIVNHVTFGDSDLGSSGSKYFNILKVAGLIQSDQEIKLYLSYDRGAPVHVGTISGNGEYVDKGTDVTIGSQTIGGGQLGGSSTGQVTANPYRREIRVNTPKFEQCAFHVEATKVGYVSITEFSYKDVRYKGRSIPPQYVG